MMDGKIASDIHVEETLTVIQDLKKCPIFESLTPGELTEISQKVTREHYAPGAVIVQQREPGEKFYGIKEGTAEVLVGQGDRATVINKIGADQFFGERALITGETRVATVRALTDMDVYVLDRETFEAARRASGSFDEQIRELVAQRH